MYEPTMSGTWFKWSALDRGEKWLVATALSCVFAGTALTLPLTDRIGIWLVAFAVVWTIDARRLWPF